MNFFTMKYYNCGSCSSVTITFPVISRQRQCAV